MMSLCVLHKYLSHSQYQYLSNSTRTIVGIAIGALSDMVSSTIKNRLM